MGVDGQMTREEAIAYFKDMNECTYGDVEPIQMAIKALEQEPREHGEWIQEEYWSEGCGMGESYGHWYRCSKCGNRVKDGYKKCGLNFCNKCGADMRRRKNNV